MRSKLVLAAKWRPKLRSGGRFAAKTPFWRPLCGQNSVLATVLRPKLRSGGRFAAKTPFWRPFCGQNSVLVAPGAPQIATFGRFAGPPWIGGPPVFYGVFGPPEVCRRPLDRGAARVLRCFCFVGGQKPQSGGCFAMKTLFWRSSCNQNSVLETTLRSKLNSGGRFWHQNLNLVAVLRSKLRSGDRFAAKTRFWMPF